MPSDLLVLSASAVDGVLSSIPPRTLLAHTAHLFHALAHPPSPSSSYSLSLSSFTVSSRCSHFESNSLDACDSRGHFIVLPAIVGEV